VGIEAYLDAMWYIKVTIHTSTIRTSNSRLNENKNQKGCKH